MIRPVRTALHAVYVLALPVLLVGIFATGFISLAEIEEWDGGYVHTIYGSPITPLFVGVIAGPALLLSYLAYWLVCHLSGDSKDPAVGTEPHQRPRELRSEAELHDHLDGRQG